MSNSSDSVLHKFASIFPRRTDNPEEMRSWLESRSENAVRAEGTDFKKTIFVNECSASDPSGIVQNAKKELLRQFTDFFVPDDLYLWPTVNNLGHGGPRLL